MQNKIKSNKLAETINLKQWLKNKQHTKKD